MKINYLLVRFIIALLIKIMTLATPVFAEDLKVKINEPISSGVFENYNWKNRALVTATMLANPNRLKSVEFVGGYNINDIPNGDENFDSAITNAFILGGATIGYTTPEGFFEVDEELGLKISASL